MKTSDYIQATKKLNEFILMAYERRVNIYWKGIGEVEINQGILI